MTVESGSGQGRASIAYLTMEVGLEAAMPTYSGGLGILAGDTLKAAADLGIPVVGVTLLYRKGYFRQHLDARGEQSESPSDWEPDRHLEALPPVVTIRVEGRTVLIRAWRYAVRGMSGHVVPVYFLDTALPENDPFDRTLTDTLYGGDERYRLCQETVLGMGGVAMLRALGQDRLGVFHMNEGHSALLTVALLREQLGDRALDAAGEAEVDAVRRRCVFTTHTPVPAGHDQFPGELAETVLGRETIRLLERVGFFPNGTLNMTRLGLFFSRYINGVALRHKQVSRDMFPEYPIDSITNGVHALTWVAEPMARLFDTHLPEWRRDPLYLRHVIGVSLEEIQTAHAGAKTALLDEVARHTGERLDPATFTIGFARRATTYKRPDLLFSDLARLERITKQVGRVQVLYAGKAHPKDEPGKELIRRIHQASERLRNGLRVVYLENYDMTLGRFLTSGVDLWLNTPRKPQEASGTSGMKAALNGVPSFSIVDGWWYEGHIEGVTGWSIGDDPSRESDDARESRSLYAKLERVILPMYYKRPREYATVMRHAIAHNGSYFTAQRMMVQYVRNAYRPADPVALADLLGQT